MRPLSVLQCSVPVVGVEVARRGSGRGSSCPLGRLAKIVFGVDDNTGRRRLLTAGLDDSAVNWSGGVGVALEVGTDAVDVFMRLVLAPSLIPAVCPAALSVSPGNNTST